LVYVYYNLRLWVKQLDKEPDIEAITLDNIDTTSQWRVEIQEPEIKEALEWLEEHADDLREEGGNRGGGGGGGGGRCSTSSGYRGRGGDWTSSGSNATTTSTESYTWSWTWVRWDWKATHFSSHLVPITYHLKCSI
jgi:hypothetical protein